MATAVNRAVIEITDPAALLDAHHAGLIVNQESLRQMIGHFNGDQFDPIKVAWVSDGAARELRIVDGFTRTYAFVHHAETVRTHYPDLVLPAIDVTAGLLQNPTIAEPGAAPTRDALTPAEYLRALIPPTVVHAEIADRRVAAYIVWAWPWLVGPPLAEHLSALAAVWFLQDRRWEFTPEAHPGPYVTDETPADRAALTRGLETLARLLQEAAKDRPDSMRRLNIGEALWQLVSTRDPAIGGADARQRQIYGLLHDPIVTEKLSKSDGPHPQKSPELRRAMLASAIITRIIPAGEEYRIVAMLRDPDWQYSDIMTVLWDVRAEFSESYRTQRSAIQARRWAALYRAKHRRAADPVSQKLFQQLAQAPQSHTYDPAEVLAEVSRAVTLLQHADYWRPLITTKRDQAAARQGVTAWYDGLLAAFDPVATWSDVSSVHAASSLGSLRKALGVLGYRIRSIEPELARAQRQAQQEGQVVTEILEKLDTPADAAPIVRQQIRDVIQSYTGPDAAMKHLRSLDPDLLRATLDGRQKLTAATTIQRHRDTIAPSVTSPPPALIVVPKAGDAGAIQAACAQLVELLTGIDGAGLDMDTTQALDAVAQTIGQLRYNVRDLPRLALDEYPSLSKRYTRLLEQHTARSS